MYALKSATSIEDSQYAYIGDPSGPQTSLLPLVAPAYRRSEPLCINRGARLLAVQTLTLGGVRRTDRKLFLQILKGIFKMY